VAVFVRGVNENFQLVTQLLELVSVTGETGADGVFFLVTVSSKYELRWEKLVGFVSDGDPAVSRKTNGFATELKERE
jgi:hypothetical protein